MPSETTHVISFAGLIGDGAVLIVPTGINSRKLHSSKSSNSIEAGSQKNGFSHWHRSGNIFLQKLTGSSKECQGLNLLNGAISRGCDGAIVHHLHDYQESPRSGNVNHLNGYSASEEENEDLLADFIDEDSQLPSRISRPNLPKRNLHVNDEDSMAQTGSSLSLLR